MVKIPQFEGKEQLSTQSPNVRQSPELEAQAGKNLQLAGETITKVADHFKNLADLNQQTKASNFASDRLSQVQQEALESDDLEGGQLKVESEIAKIKGETLSKISLPASRNKFSLQFDNMSDQTKFKTQQVFRKRLIENQKLEFLTGLDNIKKNSLTPEADLKDAIQANVSAGIISAEKGAGLLKSIPKAWQEEEIRDAIANDPEIAQEMIRAGGKRGDLSADETAKWLEVAESQDKRNEKIAKEKRDERHLQGAGTLVENLEQTTTKDIVDMLANDEISAEVAEDLITWKTTEGSVGYETNKQIWMEMAEESLKPDIDLRKFQERIAKSIARNEIQPTDGANLSLQVKALYEGAIAFKAQENNKNKLIKAGMDYIKTFAGATKVGTTGVKNQALNKSYNLSREFFRKVQEQQPKDEDIPKVARSVVADQVRSENPETVSLNDVPNTTISQEKPFKRTFEGDTEAKATRTLQVDNKTRNVLKMIKTDQDIEDLKADREELEAAGIDVDAILNMVGDARGK